jgi:hypothetical protein
MVTYVQRDLVRQKKPKLVRNFFQGANGAWNSMPFGLNLGNVVAMQPSPSWRYLCVFRQADKKDPEEKDKYSIEIWDESQVILSIPTDLKHASVYADSTPLESPILFAPLCSSDAFRFFMRSDWFGSISWSSDEKFIAYIAEKNPEKVAGFFDIEKSSYLPAYETTEFETTTSS